jgi:hypothetical protein
MQPYVDIESLANRASELREYITSEEGSKTSLVLPLLSLLGYDVFNPKQITAELTADVGVKKGEKVDYAIMGSGKPKLIIECKKVGSSLDATSISQLFRYFTALRVRLGVLTDGITYKFFSDIDAPNRMDGAPFFEFNLVSHTQADIDFLLKFRRGCLNGQMKMLLKECKKRRLVSIIRGSIRYALKVSPNFVEDVKQTLAASNLSSITKREIDMVSRRVALEEAIRVVEDNIQVDTLAGALKKLLPQVIGKDIAGLVTYRLTANSVYLEGAKGNQLARVFSSGLDLRISFNNGSSAKPIRVIDDIRRYSDDLVEVFSMQNVRG